MQSYLSIGGFSGSDIVIVLIWALADANVMPNNSKRMIFMMIYYFCLVLCLFYFS